MKNKKLIFCLIVGILLLGHFTLQFYLSRADSQTTDEGVHLSAGYTYLTKHDFRFNPEHPPLLKYLVALPLLALHPLVPPDSQYFGPVAGFYYDSWWEARAFGEDLMYKLGNNADQILGLARFPAVIITMLLGLSVFIIATRLWGKKGGFLSLLLFVFDPLILAHGHLVTTDIAASFGYIMTLYLLWVFLNKRTAINLFTLGIVLGIAELCKFTTIVLYPAIIVLTLYYFVSSKTRFKGFWRVFGMILFSFAISFLIIWDGYGFKSAPAPIYQNDINHATLNNFLLSDTFKVTRRVLIPRDYFKGLSMVVGHTENGHPSFLLGNVSQTGWWYYFPVVFLAKTPIPTLLIFCLALFILVKEKKDRQKKLFFLIGALIFFVFAMFSKANLGVRHIMPFYATMIVFAGSAIEAKKAGAFAKYAAGILILWLIVESVVVFPNFISYYNEFYGGTKNGYKVAADSNYDWGQDIKRIKSYINKKGIINPWVEYTWDSEKSLDYYNISRKPLNSINSGTDGFLIIGATALSSQSYYALQQMVPYDRITPSVFVFKIKGINGQ